MMAQRSSHTSALWPKSQTQQHLFISVSISLLIEIFASFLSLILQPQQQSSGSSQTALAPLPSPSPQRAPLLSPRLASVHSEPLYLALFLPTEPGPSPSGHVCNPSHTAATTNLTNQQFSGARAPRRHPLPRYSRTPHMLDDREREIVKKYSLNTCMAIYNI